MKANTPGGWLAVAYEEAFFIGQIVSTNDNNTAYMIQFLRQTNKKTSIFQWPSVKDVDEIDKKYILDIQINITAANRDRIYIVKNIDEIEKEYLCYSAKYF